MLPKKLPRSRAAVRRPGKNARKAPLCRAFLCAEEDSNLHPVSLDQALNLVTLVSYPSGSRQIVRIVPAHGRYGRIGRSGCCHGCCHDRPRRLCGGPAAPMPRRRPAMASSSAGARRCPRPTVVRVPEDRAPGRRRARAGRAMSICGLGGQPLAGTEAGGVSHRGRCGGSGGRGARASGRQGVTPVFIPPRDHGAVARSSASTTPSTSASSATSASLTATQLAERAGALRLFHNSQHRYRATAGRDRARDPARRTARRRILAGGRRPAGSKFIWPRDGDGSIALTFRGSAEVIRASARQRGSDDGRPLHRRQPRRVTR
jgi:hypothetical protein